jgi:hypothetical protein
MVGWEGVRRTQRDVRDNLHALFEARGNRRIAMGDDRSRLGAAQDCDAMDAIEGMTIRQATLTLLRFEGIWEPAR